MLITLKVVLEFDAAVQEDEVVKGVRSIIPLGTFDKAGVALPSSVTVVGMTETTHEENKAADR